MPFTKKKRIIYFISQLHIGFPSYILLRKGASSFILTYSNVIRQTLCSDSVDAEKLHRPTSYPPKN